MTEHSTLNNEGVSMTKDEVLKAIGDILHDAGIVVMWTGKTLSVDMPSKTEASGAYNNEGNRPKPWMHVASTFVVFKNGHPVYADTYREGTACIKPTKCDIDGDVSNTLSYLINRRTLKDETLLFDTILKSKTLYHKYQDIRYIFAAVCRELVEIGSVSINDFADELGCGMDTQKMTETYMKCARNYKTVSGIVGYQNMRKLADFGRMLDDL